MSEAASIPKATVGRLPLYLRVLIGELEAGAETVLSETLAEKAGATSAIVRKDLSHIGSHGTRGVGYDVRLLISEINRQLGLQHVWPCVIVGVGHLGAALASYLHTSAPDFVVAGLIDSDPAKRGQNIAGVQVLGDDRLAEIVCDRSIKLGIIATPPAVAQPVADRLVAAGVDAILSFAPTRLLVPENVTVRPVDLAVELQVLAFYQQRRKDADLSH